MSTNPYPVVDPGGMRRFFIVAAAMIMLSQSFAYLQARPHDQASAAAITASAQTTEAATADTKQQVAKSLAKMPLSFVENAGQVQDEVSFMLQGSDTSLGFFDDGVVWRLSDKEDAYSVRQVFVGGTASTPVGVDRQHTTFSWFKGAPSEWVTGAAAYSAVRYEDVWPGIDVVYSGNASLIKYRFVVSPGAGPSQIRVAYRGAETSLTGSGELQVKTPVKTLSDEAPHSYQGTSSVASSYALHTDGTYSFEVGNYDATRALVIDPAIVSAGYIGGPPNDVAYAIAVDSAGASYVSGYTSSTQASFPVTGGPDLTHNGGTYDAFVAKVAPSGAPLAYAGYIGGAGDEVAYAIAVDSAGASYVSGYTSSTEFTFPVTGGPDLTHNGGTYDAFVAKVAPSGASLAYAGYIGGSGDDFGRGIAVDSSGAAYVTGDARSTQATFPVTGGPDLTYNGGADAFVAKVAPSGASLAYAGYIGGSSDDLGDGIAVDSSGSAYVSGETSSTQATFPVTGGPDLIYNGSGDAFVAKVVPSGASLAYAGYIGGSGSERGRSIAVDSSGSAYVSGETSSTELTFPVTGGPDLIYNGGGFGDAFVAKVAPSGASLAYAGYIGGSGDDYGQGIAVDSSGFAYVSGYTSSSELTFPVAGGPDLTHNGGTYDAFVAKVAPSGASLAYAGYIGGSGSDAGQGIAVDSSGFAYVSGYTSSSELTFPVTGGPDLTYNGGYDAFVARLSAGSDKAVWDPSVEDNRVLNRPLTCDTPDSTCTDSGHSWSSGAPALAASVNGATHFLHAAWTTDAPTGDESDAVVKHGWADPAIWGSSGSGAGQFLSPSGLAIAPSGEVYVTDSTNRRIQRFSSSGAFISAWGWDVDTAAGTGFELCTVAANCKTGVSGAGAGQFNNPAGLAVDSSGNVYVADRGNNRIQKFSSSGAFISAWGWDVDTAGGTGLETCTVASSCQIGASGSGAGQFAGPAGPYGVAVDSSGDILVVDTSNNRIQKFSPSGAFISTWGSSGTTGGQFSNAADVAVGPSGDIYVTDLSNRRLQRFSSSGAFISTWGWNVDTAVGTGFELCTVAANCKAGVSGGGAGQFNNPAGVAVDASGDVYATDVLNRRIQKFSSSGAFISTWGWDVDTASGTGFELCAVVVNCQTGISGAGAGQFNNPTGVAVGAYGGVYVVDKSNTRIQRFAQCGIQAGGSPYCSGVYYARSTDTGATDGAAGTWDGGAAAAAPFMVSPADTHAGRAAIAASGAYVHVAYVTTTGYGDGMCAEDPRVLWVRTNTNYGASGSWLAPVRLTGLGKEVDYPVITASGASVQVIYTRGDTGVVKVALSTDDGANFTTQEVGRTSATYDNQVSGSAVCPGAPTPNGEEGFSARASIAASGTLVGASWIRNITGRVIAKISTDGGATFASGQCTGGAALCTMHLAPEGALGPDGRSLVSVAAASGRLGFSWVYDTGIAAPKGLYVRTYQSAGGWGPQRLVSCMQNTAPCGGAPAAALYNDGYSPSVAMYGTSGVAVAWSACPYPGPTTPCDQTASDPGADLLYKESWNNGATWWGGETNGGTWGSYRLLASNTGTNSAVNERAILVFDDRAVAGATGCAQSATSTLVGLPVVGCQRYVAYTGHTKYTTGGWFASNAATTRLYMSIGTQQ